MTSDPVSELYDNAPCGYFSTEKNGLITKINATLCEWLLYEKSEIIGKLYLYDILSIGSKIYSETHFFPLLQIQGFVKEINLEMKKKNGGLLPILINSKIEGRVTDENFYLNSAVVDISQRKKYEKELLIAKKNADALVLRLSKSNAELEKFNYVISHDLKSPLATIIMVINELKEIAETDPNETLSNNKNFIEYLETSAKKLNKMIENVLIFYKNQTLSISEKTSIDIRSTISSIVHLLNFENKYKITVPEFTYQITVDSTALEQVILNLLTNAIKYNDKPIIEITIDYKIQANSITISIKDNGPGIKKQDQEKIFMLFTNLGKSDNKGQMGTGIGLATVKALVEKFEGTVWVESEPGYGSEFFIQLPI